MVRTLATHPTPATIEHEITRCASLSSTDPTRCLYVTRAVGRLLPVLRQHHDLDSLAAAFQHSPSYAYDRAILEAPTTGRWYQAALTPSRRSPTTRDQLLPSGSDRDAHASNAVYSHVLPGESCRDLEHLGIALDEVANTLDAPIISQRGGLVTVRMIETDEDVMIARHTYGVLAA